MRVLRQFVLILAVVLPLLVPTMACAVPNVHLSATERACCKSMGSQCGTQTMPASHGCCSKEVPAANHWQAAVQVNFTNIQMDLSAVTEPMPAVLPLLPMVLPDYGQWLETALPQSSPPTITSLRI